MFVIFDSISASQPDISATGCGVTNVLFHWKWLDTRKRVISSNNFTTINKRHGMYKDDQLICASQAEQLFYIREPSRSKQNNNHQCVVEHVNHRSI